MNRLNIIFFIALGICITGLLLLQIANQQQEINAQGIELNDTKLFAEPKIGLSINYQSDWSALPIPGDLSDDDHLYFVDFCPVGLVDTELPNPRCETDSPVNLGINAYKLKDGTTTNEFYEDKLTQIRAAEGLAGKLEIIDKDKVTIDTLPAVQVISTRDKGSGSIGELLSQAGVEQPTSKNLDLFFVNKNGSIGYTISGGTEVEVDFDTYLPTIQKMIDSLKIE